MWLFTGSSARPGKAAALSRQLNKRDTVTPSIAAAWQQPHLSLLFFFGGDLEVGSDGLKASGGTQDPDTLERLA